MKSQSIRALKEVVGFVSIFAVVLLAGLAVSAAQLWGQNLIVNGNFENNNTGFRSAYRFSPGNMVPAGTYDVTDDLKDDNGNFAQFGDHTSGSGKMMPVNGATTANQTVWTEMVNLDPNSTYGFAAWVASLTTTSPAVLRFSINGQQLGQDFNAPGTTGNWVQFTGVYFSGAGGNVPITIVDQNTAANGNDFALDDLSLIKLPNPEPSTMLMFGSGIVGVAGFLRRRLNRGSS